MSDFDEMEEHFKLRRYFNKFFVEMMQKESSDFGKLLLQQNLISYEMISFLRSIESLINVSDILSSGVKWDIDKIIHINLPKNLEEFTLGQLIHILQGFVLKDHKLLKDLKMYNKKRNDLTHKILYKYFKLQGIRELNKDTRSLIIIGDRILQRLTFIDQKWISQFE